MKKFITLFLMSIITLSLTSCGVPDRGNLADNFSEFRWPNSELANLLPVPKSNIGEIVFDRADLLRVNVGETSKDDFNDFIDECMTKGFTVNYSRRDSFFKAENNAGFELSIDYSSLYRDTMTIRLSIPSEDEPEPKNEPEPEDIPEPEDAPELEDEPDILDNSQSDEEENDEEPIVSDVDWKEFLRLYEEWIDSYIELLEKYNEDPTDITILNDYLKMMVELAEWAEMAEQVEADLINNPDALKEYLETLSRIILKLSEVEF